MFKKIMFLISIFFVLPIIAESFIVNQSGLDDIEIDINKDVTHYKEYALVKEKDIPHYKKYTMKKGGQLLIQDKIEAIGIKGYKENNDFKITDGPKILLRPVDRENLAKGESYIAIKKLPESTYGINLEIVSDKYTYKSSIGYFNDMENPIEITIVPLSYKGLGLITFEVSPHSLTQVRVPLPIEALTINEFNKAGKIIKTETLISGEEHGYGSGAKRLVKELKLTKNLHYGYSDTLNATDTDRYVIVHNRINPYRNFRLLTKHDFMLKRGDIQGLKAEKTEKEKEKLLEEEQERRKKDWAFLSKAARAIFVGQTE